MMALAISATVFTSCEDVPSPYNMTFDNDNVTPTPQPKTDLNTEATAWTVAEAVQKIQTGQASNGEAYVKGIISAITYYDQNHKSLTYYLSDNGTDKTLQIFSGKGVNGADFAAKTDLQVGQTVVVKGNLKEYTNKLWRWRKVVRLSPSVVLQLHNHQQQSLLQNLQQVKTISQSITSTCLQTSPSFGITTLQTNT